MRPSLEVLFTPADFAALRERNLSQAVCVVFDVLRATSSMITALAHGAEAIWPVEEIPEALAIRARETGVLLAGERDGLRITAAQTGSSDFDFGNSPREFTSDGVSGKTIVMTTTNGTRALRACIKARRVLAASFLNLETTCQALAREPAGELLVVCSGTFDQAAYEDVLGAGALCQRLWERYGDVSDDSARIARELYRLHEHDLLSAFGQGRNGRRLLGRPELREDVAFCAQRDVFPLTAELGRDGLVRRTG